MNLTPGLASFRQRNILLAVAITLSGISAVRRATLVLKGDTALSPDALYQAAGVKPFLPSVAWR